jgi:hypothetical protein
LFISPWCESYLATSRPNRASACRTAREAFATLARDASVRWIAIGAQLWSTHQELAEYRDKYALPAAFVFDESGDLFRTFHISQVPIVLLADASGKILQRLDAASPELRSAVAALRGR